MSFDTLVVDEHDGIRVVTLNRPRALNAFNAKMRDELRHVLGRVNEDSATRAVVITGAGEKAFCAGQDLVEASNFDPALADAWVEDLRTCYETIRGLDKPCVAALNGVAAGAGIQIALLADMRIGHSGLRMGQPEINVGLASVIGVHLLTLSLGHARAVDLALTGRLMDAEECHRIGLVNKLVPVGQVLDEALACANELASKPVNAMRLTKKRFRDATQAGFDATLAAAAPLQVDAYRSGEPHEAMARFRK